MLQIRKCSIIRKQRPRYCTSGQQIVKDNIRYPAIETDNILKELKNDMIILRNDLHTLHISSNEMHRKTSYIVGNYILYCMFCSLIVITVGIYAIPNRLTNE